MVKQKKIKYKESLFDDYSEAEPEAYEVFNKIKAPLSVLNYNYNFKFQDNYPAKFHPDFVRDMIEIFSTDSSSDYNVVWDAFGGSGIVPRTAVSLGRKGIYSDINPKAFDLAKKHAKRLGHDTDDYVLHDVRTINLNRLGFPKANLCLSSPPFGLNIVGDKNSYSDENDDLSNCADYPRFFREMSNAIQNIYENLAPLGFLILDAKDRTKDKIFQPMSIRFFNIAERVGFKPITRFVIPTMPSRVWTSKIPGTDFPMAVPAAYDVIVMMKPANYRIDGY